jgi:amidase
VKRRGFLKASAAGCALALVEPVSSFSETKESTITPPAFELEEMSVSELQQGMQSGKYSSRSLVEKYVDRINDIDKRGPALIPLSNSIPMPSRLLPPWTKNAKTKDRAGRSTGFLY